MFYSYIFLSSTSIQKNDTFHFVLIQNETKDQENPYEIAAHHSLSVFHALCFAPQFHTDAPYFLEFPEDYDLYFSLGFKLSWLSAIDKEIYILIKTLSRPPIFLRKNQCKSESIKIKSCLSAFLREFFLSAAASSRF